MKERFCYIEEDEEKALRYATRFFNFYLSGESREKVMKIGNEIQIEELANHIDIMVKAKKIGNDDISKNEERLNWILDKNENDPNDKHLGNGRNFRKYLSSLKIIAYICARLYGEINKELFTKEVRKMNKEDKLYFESMF